jgi:hypothetical protein
VYRLLQKSLAQQKPIQEFLHNTQPNTIPPIEINIKHGKKEQETRNKKQETRNKDTV